MSASNSIQLNIVFQLAAGMSMGVSFVSAVTLIGYPVEVYFYGIFHLWGLAGILLGTVMSAVYYIPLLFRLRMNSVFEVRIL